MITFSIGIDVQYQQSLKRVFPDNLLMELDECRGGVLQVGYGNLKDEIKNKILNYENCVEKNSLN